MGLEPVTVRARSNDEVWVVNHVSDSISIIKVSELNVTRTLSWATSPPTSRSCRSQHAAFVCISQEDLIRVYDTNDLNPCPRRSRSR